ncbi:hypothetical protein ABZX30_13890 [Streptomyces sp. NPDC004542]|uniref:hypothetical protein n=1 Tax=Streptomyces sp. NPDC004542 TaxID=3154281 RepID=UPI0033AF10BD
MTRTPLPPSQLPLSGATLTADPSLLSAVRAIGTRRGVDYTDDATVTALLTERRRALEATQRGPLAWLGGLTLTAGVMLPLSYPFLPAQAAKAALIVAILLIAVAVATLVQVRVRWKRELTHPALAGYREVLGMARAHGLPLEHVPGWLEGRNSGPGGDGGRKTVAPIPSYEAVPAGQAIPPNEHQGEDERETDQGGHTPPPVPPKPPAVTEYETLADQGGWHDEAGCLLALAGVVGALWAAMSDEPVGYGALALIPLAVLIWLAGLRQYGEKQRLRAEAVAYVRAVMEAQADGARVPELSPTLRRLLGSARPSPPPPQRRSR